jgi:hypothetical protein
MKKLCIRRSKEGVAAAKLDRARWRPSQPLSQADDLTDDVHRDSSQP